MANLKNGTLNYFLTKDLDALENRENALKEMNKMDPTYPDPNDPRFTDPAPVFTIQDNQLCRDGVAIGKIYNNKTGKVVEITETTETGFKYQDTEEDALINKDNSIAVVEKLTGLKGEIVSKPNNIITYEASAKLPETTSDKNNGLHTNAFNTTIVSHTFENGVGTIEFEEDVTTIGYKAFSYCSGLSTINIPNSVTEIESWAFEGSDFNTLIIPNSVTTIGHNAFDNCTNLTSVTLSNNLTYIDDCVFQDCIGLLDITIPSGVTFIGDSTFQYCSSLTSVTIPNSVTRIGGRAFRSCSSLTSIDIPDSVTSIGNSAFEYCGLTSINIPNGITTINEGVFAGCSSLITVVISNNIISIGVSAFNNCSGLISVTIGSGVTSIGGLAFQSCNSLESITSLATTAPTIQSSTFDNVKVNGSLYVPQGSTGYDVWMDTINYYLGYYNWTKIEQ